MRNDNNRFADAKITGARVTELQVPELQDHTLRKIRSRHDEERKWVSEMICKLLQYQGAREVEIDKFNSNPLEYQYFVSVFNQVAEKKVSDQMGSLTRLFNKTLMVVKERS